MQHQGQTLGWLTKGGVTTVSARINPASTLWTDTRLAVMVSRQIWSAHCFTVRMNVVRSCCHIQHGRHSVANENMYTMSSVHKNMEIRYTADDTARLNCVKQIITAITWIRNTVPECNLLFTNHRYYPQDHYNSY